MSREVDAPITQFGDLRETEERIAAEFGELTNADFGVTYTVRTLHDGRHVISRSAAVDRAGGHGEVPELWRFLDLTELPPFWLPELPVRGHVNTVQPMWSLFTDEDRRRLPDIDRYYLDTGLHDAVRILVYDGVRFAGYLAGQRSIDRPRFSREEVDRLRRVSRRCIEAVVALDRRRHAGENEPAHAMFRPDGSLEAASEGGRAWMTAALRSRVARRIAQLERGHHGAPDHDTLSIVRLEANGFHRYLVNFPSTAVPFIRGAAALTPRQREIAALVSVGASAKEAAEHLKISHHTVRQHLKVVYRLLGVASRVELARAMSEPLVEE